MKFYEILKLVEVPVSVAFSLVLFGMARDAAFAQRGFRGIGGELFVFPIALLFFVWMFETAIRYARKRDRKKRGRRK